MENEDIKEDLNNESATKPTIESMKAGERLSEILETIRQKSKPMDSDLRNNSETYQSVLDVIQNISFGNLNEALFTLPFSHVICLLNCIKNWFLLVLYK